MHTDENQNSQPVRFPKGKQIAPNVAEHYNAELFTNKDGEMYPVVVLNPSSRLIRGEYHPIGYRLNFPKYWGKKTGVEYLLKHCIAEKERTLAMAQSELDKMRACLAKVSEWPDE